jgi:predicted ATPase
MAVHTGDAEWTMGGYRGPASAFAHALLAAAHPGQILVSAATEALLSTGPGAEEAGVKLTDLGRYRLRGAETPRRFFQAEAPGLLRDFPPPLAEPTYSPRLPLRFTRFFGRERELDELDALLGGKTARLVTLTGPGGSGKTRLAIELAETVSDRFAGAVWFVPLADLADPAHIPGAILNALREPRAPHKDPLEQAIYFFQRQPSLLLLDNFEHLVEGGAAGVHALLEGAPALTVLATSRRRLGLEEEREYPIGPLLTPSGGEQPEPLSMYESVQLFVDRAQTVKPDFAVTNQNAAAVAELCDRLEGIPLAIELAAARAQVLTPAQMLEQLGRRFEFLVSRRRNAPERHRTLRGAVEWSYRLLVPEFQKFFRKLSIFRGGWTLAAAEAVCEEPLALDYLAELRDASLILSDETPLGMRFRMLETLREYAEEQLSEQERKSLQKAHATHYLKVLGQGIQRRTTSQIEWAIRINQEAENHRKALDWCETDEADDLTRCNYVILMGSHWTLGATAYESWKRITSILPKISPNFQEGRSRVLHYAAQTALDCGLLDQVGPYLSEAMDIFRERSDRHDLAGGFNTWGVYYLEKGDGPKALENFERSLDLCSKIRGDTAPPLYNIGDVFYRQGDYLSACHYYQESLRADERKEELGLAIAMVGRVKLNLGEYEAGWDHLKRALAGYEIIGSVVGIALVLAGMADYFEENERDLRRAAQLAGMAKSLADSIGLPANRYFLVKDRFRQTLQQKLGKEYFEEACRNDKDITLEEAVAYAYVCYEAR